MGLAVGAETWQVTSNTKVKTNALLNALLPHREKTTALPPLLQALIRWTLVALDLEVTLDVERSSWAGAAIMRAHHSCYKQMNLPILSTAQHRTAQLER